MGLLDSLIGNASKVDSEKIQQEFAQLLLKEENVEHAYKLIRDTLIFTNKRLLLVNKQGVTGKKIEYKSIPYSKISVYSIETAGHFDLDAELKIWVSGYHEAIVISFNNKVNIYEVEQILSNYVL